MRIVGLDHIQIAMPATGESDARVLRGAPRTERGRQARGGPGLRRRLWFRGGVEVHLGIEQDFRPAVKAHPCFLVEGYEELLARLAAAGHPSTPDNRIVGAPRSFVADPFGNRIELRPL